MSENHPEIRWGKRVTEGFLESMLSPIARKTADTTRSSTATPADDPHITFEVVADAVYVMDGWLTYSAAADADILFGFSVPSGTGGQFSVMGPGNAETTQDNTGHPIRTVVRDQDGSPNTQVAAGLGTTASDISAVLLYGIWRVGSTAGTLALQWSQNTSQASDAVLYTDSRIRLQRIA